MHNRHQGSEGGILDQGANGESDATRECNRCESPGSIIRGLERLSQTAKKPEKETEANRFQDETGEIGGAMGAEVGSHSGRWRIRCRVVAPHDHDKRGGELQPNRNQTRDTSSVATSSTVHAAIVLPLELVRKRSAASYRRLKLTRSARRPLDCQRPLQHVVRSRREPVPLPGPGW